MNNKLNKIERFFEDDLKIKKILHDVAPNEITDSYDSVSRTNYSNKLYQAIKDIEYYITDIIKLELLSLTKEDIIKIKLLLHQMNNKLANCGDNFNKLKQFYQSNFSDMKESLIDLVGKECVGYTLFDPISELTSNASTINELLHCFHSSITNNEQLYKTMPKLGEKKIFNGESVRIYGKENDLAIDIFNKIPLELDSGDIDILSLNNSQKILMMIRDRGHALTIEINFDRDSCIVNYFIPKICNAEMINILPGVHKVTNNSPFTTGLFKSDLDNLATNLVHFIEKVPTDNMAKKVGPHYRN